MDPEELTLDLDLIEQDASKKIEFKNRYQQLSEKVITTSKERDEAKAAIEAEKSAKAVAEKERDFYKSFSQISSKHPEAANFQDQILERVNKGYDPEEAALAVLAINGKLGQQPVVQATISAEGGSSPTILPGNKSPNEMNTDEKFDVLSKMTNDELARALRG